MVKAVVVDEAGAPPQVREIVLPAVGPHDVRVKILAAGVCHSDFSMVTGTVVPKFPVVLGHEAAGVVVEVGSDVVGVSQGTHVILNWAPACRQCWYCTHGEPWLCKAVEGVISVPRCELLDGTPLNVALGVGAFAEEVVLPGSSVLPVPDGVPIDTAALLGCAVLTGFGAVRNTARVQVGESVMVMGVGGIGLSAIAGARVSGAATVIAVDVSPEKEELARAMGATDFLLAGDDLGKRVRALTGGRGVDQAFECVGSSRTIRTAWQATRRGGSCTVVGVGRRDDEVTFNSMELFHFARTLQSSVFGSSDPASDVPLMADLLRTGRVDLAGMVTHRGGLADVAEAFDRMGRGSGGRTVVFPNGMESLTADLAAGADR